MSKIMRFLAMFSPWSPWLPPVPPPAPTPEAVTCETCKILVDKKHAATVKSRTMSCPFYGAETVKFYCPAHKPPWDEEIAGFTKRYRIKTFEVDEQGIPYGFAKVDPYAAWLAPPVAQPGVVQPRKRRKSRPQSR